MSELAWWNFVFYIDMYVLPHIEIPADDLLYYFDNLLSSEKKQKLYVIEAETALYWNTQAIGSYIYSL